MESLGHVGIADLAKRPYRELSGGQKQRALIARVLPRSPMCSFLDEPTNDMDIGMSTRLWNCLSTSTTRTGSPS